MVSIRALPSLSTSLTSFRHASNVPADEPAKKAQSILDSLPGHSLISKTAILSSGAGLSIFAISNEYFVVNEETVIMVAFFCVIWAIFKYGGPMYTVWVEAANARIIGVLNAARKGHVEAVKSRIDNVKPLSNVVDITKTLFEVSKVRFDLEFTIVLKNVTHIHKGNRSS